MPMISAFATLSSFSQLVPMASWGVPSDQFTKEEKTQAYFTDDSAGYADISQKVDSCRAIGRGLGLELTPSHLLALRPLNPDWNYTIDSVSPACQLTFQPP